MKTKTGFLFLLLRLAKDRRALLARLLRDEEGSWLISMTLMLPVLIGVAGLGTEGGMLFYQHRSLQSAADAAAYSAALACSYSVSTNPTSCASDITTQAKATVASYGFALGTGTNQANVAATPTTFATLPAVQVTISRPQSAIFSSIFFSVLHNSVSATAVLNSSNGGNCLLALGNTATGNNATGAIKITGNATSNLACGLFSNSTNCAGGASDSISLTGNITLNAASVGSAGCLSAIGNVTIGPPPNAYTEHDGTLSNPYATTSVPSTGSPGSCAGNQCTPGVYPTGISFTGNVIITLQPGVYILEGMTPFNLTGNAKISGNGVTLVFTSATPNNPSSYPTPPNAIMSVTGNASVSLTAPTIGETAGFVMMGDSTMPLNTAVNITGNVNTDLTGVVYLPKVALAWTGNLGAATGCRQFIVNTFSTTGNVALSNSGCNLAAGQPIGSIVTLVQ
jgi:Flp pilus assembly protein TadG